MKRVRWLKVAWPKALKDLVVDFRKNAFTHEKASGFLMDIIRDNYIVGRYVEQKEINEKTIDPFGKEISYKRLLFEQTEFAVFDKYQTIEVYDAPRSLQMFISKLLEICEFQLTVACFQVNLLKWIDEFQNLIESPITVESMQITDYEFEKGVIGKILLNGERDVRTVLTRFENGKPLNLANARVSIKICQKPVTIAFYANSTAHYPDLHSDYLLPLLRESILRI